MLLIALVGLVGATGCDRDAPAGNAPPKGTSKAATPTVASLVPAASDLLIGMGAGDHLVAVSNWDTDRPGTRGLPRIGDYRGVDPEQLARLRPGVLVVQFHPDKMPAGLRQRCDRLGTRLVNVRNNRLDDVFEVTRTLGEAVSRAGKAGELERKIRGQLGAVRRRVAGRPAVKTLIVRDETGFGAAGGGNFLDDLLAIAGGVNVLGAGDNSYPTLDKEQILGLDPEVILHLLPSPSPQVRERVRRHWASMPQLRAAKGGRVYVLEDYYLLHPSHRVGDTAERFADCLHGTKMTAGADPRTTGLQPVPDAPGVNEPQLGDSSRTSHGLQARGTGETSRLRAGDAATAERSARPPIKVAP